MLADCDNCNARVGIRVHGEYRFGDPREGPPTKAVLASCPECYEPMLLGVEFYGHQGDREVWSDPWRMYPTDFRRLSSAIPETIAVDFVEAQRVIRAKAYRAAIVMCRRVLEMTAAELGVRRRNLAASLDALKEDGHIDSRLYEWATELRLVGNAAAHDVGSEVSRLDAEDALAFTEAIIDYVFVYRDRFEQFQSRRQRGSEASEEE